VRGTWGRYSQRSSPIAGGPVLALGIGTASSWPFSHADEALGEQAAARGPGAEFVCAVAGCAADLGQEKTPHSPVGDAAQEKAPRAAACPETRWVPFSVPFSVAMSAFLCRGSPCTCSATAHAYRYATTSPRSPLRHENRPKVRIFWRPLCPEHLRVGCSRLSGGDSGRILCSGTRGVVSISSQSCLYPISLSLIPPIEAPLPPYPVHGIDCGAQARDLARVAGPSRRSRDYRADLWQRIDLLGLWAYDCLSHCACLGNADSGPFYGIV
jgi:hypothetical protein